MLLIDEDKNWNSESVKESIQFVLSEPCIKQNFTHNPWNFIEEYQRCAQSLQAEKGGTSVLYNQ